jgi:hypothetical protein
MVQRITLEDDGLLRVTDSLVAPEYWEPTNVSGTYTCTLPICHCRRYSYHTKKKQLVIQLHCYCKKTDCSGSDCLTCSAPNPVPSQNDDHWLRDIEPEMRDANNTKTKVSHDRTKPPSLAKRVLTYAQALKAWTTSGMPNRTDDEVQDILTTFCRPCSYYKKGFCKVCGCRVNGSNVPLINKIKMATQHCPKRRW